MKLLKKTLTYAASAALLLSGASCSDFLDKAPENKVPEEGVDYTNLNNMYQPVVGVYAQVRTGGLHWISWACFIIRDDDVWSGRFDDQPDLVKIGENFIYSNAFWGFNETWNQHYAIIRYANAALDDLEQFKANIKTQADMDRYETYRGEVCFLRAYAYYRLTQVFGDVTILRDNMQGDMTRSKRDVVYKYMLNDEDGLGYAIKHLPNLNPKDAEHPGAVTSGSAAALAAKVNLQMGNYEAVERLTDQIIADGKFDLYPDFYRLFKKEGIMSEETMFELQMTEFGLGGDEIKPGEYFTFQGPSNSGVVSGWSFIGFRNEFVKWAEDRGETVRATTTFLKGGKETPSGDYINGTSNPLNTNCWNGKVYLPASETVGTSYGSGNSVRFLRYADVLLMNAEAKVRLGKNGEYGYNEVRRRAKMSENQNPTLDDILDERRMELACEWGERYADLLRTGKAETLLNEGDKTAEEHNVVINGWTKDKAYYPIPLTQIENAPDLTNPPLAE